MKKIQKQKKLFSKLYTTNYKDIKKYLNILIKIYLKISLINLMILKLEK